VSRILKIAALQKRLGSAMPPAEFDRLRSLGVNLVCLPEYYFTPPQAHNHPETAALRPAILGQLEEWSSRLRGVVVGGTLVEEDEGRFYNACHVFDSGRHVGSYRKVHPTSREQDDGITPGSRFEVLETRGLRLGLMVCADVLFPRSFRQMAALKPDLVAVPTISPYQPDDTVERKYRRDQELFVNGARFAGAFMLKACGVGAIFGHRLQGRSLIASPFGVITRINPRAEQQEAVLTAEINLDQLKLVTPQPPSREKHHRRRR